MENSSPQGSTGDRLSLGFPGLSASAGDHIGHFYRTPTEWKDFLVAFLRAGLEANEKCAYMLSPRSRWAEVARGLHAAGIAVDEALASGQLVVGDGKPTPEEMREALDEALDDAGRRFKWLRWGGDMTWCLAKMPSTEQLLEWESACNLVEKPQAVFLCQYDLKQFRGDVVFDALRTHPLCVVGTAVHHNPLYQDPLAFLEDLRRRRADDTGANPYRARP